MKRFFKTTAVVALAWSASACDHDLAGINDNPNAPTDVPASYLLPSGIQTSVETVYGQTFHLDFAALWVQHYAKIQYGNEDRYDLRPERIDNYWNVFYAGALKDFQAIIEKGEATNTPNHTAVGLILKSWLFGIMTDVWGDIPYSQALQGDKAEGTATPAYDPQSEIYAGLLADLGRAVDLIDEGGRSFGGEDLIYGGDMAAWKKFANALRLRLAMRISNVDATAAQAAIAAAWDGTFTSNGDVAQLEFLASAPNQNPMHENWKEPRDDHAISKTLVDVLQGWSDPRLPIFAELTVEDTVYRGMPNGQPDGHSIRLSTVSRIGNFWRSNPDAPAVLMSYAEVLFLKAEAAQRNLHAGTAQALYEAGVRASLAQYGIADTQATAYLARPGVAWDANTALQQIGTQKWIALYGNGPEAYAEWRRTGFPALSPAVGTAIPRRMPYPGLEQTLNSTNLSAAISRQGTDGAYQGKVWWDVD